MKKLIPFFCICISLVACGQQQAAKAPVKQGHGTTINPYSRVIFYNVENLFDTIDDPEIQDEDFLPSSNLKWDTRKYEKKLKAIAKVIAAMCDTVSPLVVGLCEIENKQVLEDLVAQPAIAKFNFGIAHVSSEDERGIETALLYNKNLIDEDFTAKLKVDLGRDKTRDIVYFKGFIGEEFPVWFFINHWPSRREGEMESQEKRMTAARALKNKIDDIYKGEPYARIIVMGDFNDNPDDNSLKYLSGGKSKIPDHQSLVNLSKAVYENNQFTLKHQGENNVFDQFIVSKNLINEKNQYHIAGGKSGVFSAKWLLFDHPKQGLIPNRTFVGTKYVAGYSDHLPVYFDLEF